MRVASNKLKDVLAYFYSELPIIYEASEIEALVNLAVNHYLGYSRTERLLKENENINQSDLLKLYDCCKLLKKQVPLQYILREAWFYDLKFYVNTYVLIPRPETEELVDIIIKENPKATSVLDLGTGSGCIPVTLKYKLPEAAVFACDISKEALAVATKNAVTNHVAVTFVEASILDADAVQQQISQPFDVIVSNPPYIKESEKQTIEKHVIDQEPHLALFVEGDDAIIFYKKIIDLCKNKLNANGRLYFELNPLTATDVKEYALHSAQFKTVELVNDMSGNTRFLKAVKF